MADTIRTTYQGASDAAAGADAARNADNLVSEREILAKWSKRKNDFLKNMI